MSFEDRFDDLSPQEKDATIDAEKVLYLSVQKANIGTHYTRAEFFEAMARVALAAASNYYVDEGDYDVRAEMLAKEGRRMLELTGSYDNDFRRKLLKDEAVEAVQVAHFRRGDKEPCS